MWVFLGAGALVAARARAARCGGRGRPLALALVRPASSGRPRRPAGRRTLWRIGWYFAEAGAFVFGSGLAIVPFLHGGVVQEFGWLDERQFLDAVAVAMITPGPVVITVGFIGYLVAGLGRRGGRRPGHVPALLPVHGDPGARTSSAGRGAAPCARSSTA